MISDINLDENCDSKIGDQVPFSTLMILQQTITFININPIDLTMKTAFKPEDFEEY